MTQPGHARVLICEQDSEVAGQSIAMAVKEGCGYELAINSTGAHNALQRSDFDALLIDLHLPGEGGLAFARAARAGPPSLLAPIIVVAPDVRDDGDVSLGLDAVDRIDKPADGRRLTEALRQALSRSGKERPVVLHLDDDKDLLQVAAAALEPEPRIVTATDLGATRAILEDISPDAQILDLRLAGQVDSVLVKARGSLPDLKATLRGPIRSRAPGEPR